MDISLRQKMMSVALVVALSLGGGALTALSQASADAQPAYAAQSGTWKKTSGKWWYAYSNGGYAKSGWAQIGGAWYLFDSAGWMKTGWQKVGGTWYYLSGSGAMKTGWLKSGGSWYHLKSSGAMDTGWQKIGGSWYYLKSSGAMAIGWQKIGDAWYHLKSSGAMSAQTWVGDYYLLSSGAMATNQWIGQYYVGADGKWVRDANSGNESAATVYWVADGEVYHLSKDCASLKRSSGIRSGSIAESGKPRPCKVCG